MCMGDAFSVPFILSCWKLLEKFEAKGKVNVCLLFLENARIKIT